jgi:hypothetical protein
VVTAVPNASAGRAGSAAALRCKNSATFMAPVSLEGARRHSISSFSTPPRAISAPRVLAWRWAACYTRRQFPPLVQTVEQA